MATTALPRAGTYSRSWLYEWLTTTDHKKIGIMYVVSSFIFFLVGGTLALGIRTQLFYANNTFLPPAIYNQVFTMHGTTMIFFFVMPMLAGFANYAVPLMIGAADMAFPRINALSFWIIPISGLLLFSGFLFGGAANASSNTLNGVALSSTVSVLRMSAAAVWPSWTGRRSESSRLCR